MVPPPFLFFLENSPKDPCSFNTHSGSSKPLSHIPQAFSKLLLLSHISQKLFVVLFFKGQESTILEGCLRAMPAAV